MFGRHPRLPVDLFLGVEDSQEGQRSEDDYVADLRDRLDYAYKVATDHAQKQSQGNKDLYDKRVREMLLRPGDRVLVKNVGLRGKHKLADYWEKGVFRVVKRVNEDIPVYVVQPEQGNGQERALHRNLLLPLQSLPRPRPVAIGGPIPSTRNPNHPKPKPRHQSNTPEFNDNPNEDSEEENEPLWMVAIDSPSPAPRNSLSNNNNTPDNNLVPDARLRPDSSEFIPEGNPQTVLPRDSLCDNEDLVDIEGANVNVGNSLTPMVEQVYHDVDPLENQVDSDSCSNSSDTLRRSSRVRKPVERYGVSNQCTPAWQQKVDCLVNILEKFSGNPETLQNPVFQAIVHVVEGATA
ncbi:hypothetical protein HOLleu_24948 [Holothuria leucospilota]|uniref:Uncharacterized protein n=1 Tax=Holothuria leucospilota TaxID=206669 RepID=A0A9Q1BRT7_HOLLE|nr:hypothetical protein HOLleu_24948 [Holothuria leucospilota]